MNKEELTHHHDNVESLTGFTRSDYRRAKLSSVNLIEAFHLLTLSTYALFIQNLSHNNDIHSFFSGSSQTMRFRHIVTT